MISEKAGGHWYGTSREHHVSGISHPLQHGRHLPGGIIPASVSERLRLPEMRLYGILPGSWTEHVPVPRLPASDLHHGRDSHARTHLPLTVWFWAIYLCATDKRGISAVQLSRTLGICYESAWYLLLRIRAAMGQRDEKYVLSGIVEMDDGYVGGASHSGKRGRGTDKAKIVVALSKTENGAALFTRMQVVEDVTGGTLQQVIDKTIAPGAKIECDGYRSYRNLSGVTLDAKKYETGYLHWLHKAISNLKALLLGTYHGRCTQLQAYLDEFCFRFNRRKTGNQIFMRLTRAVATSCAQLR